MAAKVTIRGNLPISRIAKSPELSNQLEPFAERIYNAARRDTNERFVATIRKRPFTSRGRAGRVSWQVGAAPLIGRRVEAKRGVFARAVAFLKG